MVMRTRGARYMATVASDGGGVVWAAPSLTSVPNPNSALDVTRLADGRLLLVYNHSFKTRAPHPPQRALFRLALKKSKLK